MGSELKSIFQLKVHSENKERSLLRTLALSFSEIVSEAAQIWPFQKRNKTKMKYFGIFKLYMIDDFKCLRMLLSFKSMQKSRVLVILKDWMFAGTDFVSKRRTKNENQLNP